MANGFGSPFNFDTLAQYGANQGFTNLAAPPTTSPGFTDLIGGLTGGNNPVQFASGQPSYLDSLSGWLGKPGNAQTALGVAQGLGSTYLGLQQYGLAKDTLAENKRQFGINLENQRKLTNSQLADRQAARVASNPGGYQSVGDYLKQYGV